MGSILVMVALSSILMLVVVVWDLRGSKRSFTAIEHRIFVVGSAVVLVMAAVGLTTRDQATFEFAYELAFFASVFILTTIIIHFINRGKSSGT